MGGGCICAAWGLDGPGGGQRMQKEYELKLREDGVGRLHNGDYRKQSKNIIQDRRCCVLAYTPDLDT